MTKDLIPQEIIESRIFILRGKKVMIDWDLARLYEVKVKRLNEQVKRNLKRFPPDFMFQLVAEEKNELVAKCDRFKLLKHSSALPFAFTENGVSMLSSVLNSERAIDVNIQIMRTFTKIREFLISHTDLRNKLEELEKKYDAQFKSVFDAIKMLMAPPADPDPGPRKIIGFKPEK